jgi:hypothetical protein
MVHVIFDGADVKLTNFYQEGSGSADIKYFEGLPPKYQRGYGYFVGIPRQRGHGVGDIFRSLWRVLRPVASALSPIAKEAGKALGQEGLATGSRVLNQLVQGSDAKDAFATEGKEAVKRLVGRANARLQGGSGRRKKLNGVILKPGDIVTGHSIVDAKRRLSTIRKHPTRGAIKTRNRRIDSLGPY